MVRRIVELVDARGTTLGECPVEEAHQPPGRLHRAFSIMLFDERDRVLLQRRALSKSRFPGLWANTCCSHPAAGEDVAESAVKRLDEEMGLHVEELREVGTFVYQALDGQGAAEHEFDHVLMGDLDSSAELSPDREEIEELAWLPYAELVSDAASRPERYAPWIPGVIALIDRARSAN